MALQMHENAIGGDLSYCNLTMHNSGVSWIFPRRPWLALNDRSLTMQTIHLTCKLSRSCSGKLSARERCRPFLIETKLCAVFSCPKALCSLRWHSERLTAKVQMQISAGSFQCARFCVLPSRKLVYQLPQPQLSKF